MDAASEGRPDARGSGDASGPEPDAGLSPELAIALPVARAYCEWWSTCTPGSFRDAYLGGLEHCVRTVGQYFAQVIPLEGVSPIEGWCMPTLANDADCDALFDCVPSVGTLSEGEACLDGRQCGRASNGRPMQCQDCRCARPPSEGEDCADARCDEELGMLCIRFDDGDRCVSYRLAAVGEACDASAAVLCEEGAWCVEGACVRRPRRGEACEPDGAPCFIVSASRTWASACAPGDDGGHRCHDPLDAVVVAGGEPCVRGDSCGGGGSCPASGVCPTTCGFVEDRLYQCGPGEGCLDGTCFSAPLYCPTR